LSGTKKFAVWQLSAIAAADTSGIAVRNCGEPAGGKDMQLSTMSAADLGNSELAFIG
jgi:hypothetical protein